MPGDPTPTPAWEAGSAGDTGRLLAAREVAYDVLKCAFLEEPSASFIRLLIEADVVRAFSFADGHAGIREALAGLGDCLEQPDVLSDGSIQRLHWDYTRMFVGPGRVPAPPWESLYRSVERLHFSEGTLQVRAAYQKYGLSHAGFGREPEDHVGLELDFMRQLCAMAGGRADHAGGAELLAILEDQRAFLDEHLLSWIPTWTGDVVRSAHTAFYRNMARLLAAYLAFDRAIVERLTEVASRRGCG